ncbi:hypothetical protein D0Z08_10975 [Nocardioides immobilis]|uniref:Uncharacterized protein n=2 Tax=Nocardioides immobilis TaxID=2049295 RepID=A0A417Y3D6_9ACTN|nr:hypothetical protein D0Z08_10975 [Nocardioides immobilis]
MDQQIPERRLSDEARARRRTELMEAITADDTRTRRWLAPVAAAAVVAGLVGGGYAVTRLGDNGAPDQRPERSLDVAGSGTATPSTQPTPVCGDITAEEPEQSMRDRAATPLWRDPAVAPSLQSYRDILVRHLDPRDAHLERRVTNIQAGGSPECGFDSLGTKLGWNVAGEDGLGMVQVEVSTSRRDSQVGMTFDVWDGVHSGLPGVERAEVAGDGDRMAVLVTRSDGLAVGILADPLFGNNAVTPVSGFEFTIHDLVATAADPEFALP